MPKSRKRRTKNRALAELPLLEATDAAEARGDAWGALQLIQRDLARRNGAAFWRPERLHRLAQLVAFEPSLPRWATSRWLLAQAAQHLDPRTRTRFHRAIEIAVDARGGPETLVGVDAVDARAKVMDHDWVFRQVWLHELGALEHFVNRVASPDLLAGADRIHDWIRTPMGGFRLVGEAPHSLSLMDLATGDEVTALNIGSATLLEVGDCAIGRRVPIEGGAMFESAPLHVPDGVAHRVAGDPADWVAAVAAGCREGREQRGPALITTMPEFGMLTDVPHLLQIRLAVEAAWARGEELTPQDLTPDRVTSLEVGLVRAALDDRLPETDWEEKQWPMVAATLLEPRVFLDLVDGLAPVDGPRLLGLADRLAGPAGPLCRTLAHEIEAAA